MCIRDRVKALMAFQLMLGLFTIFLGVIKWAKKVVFSIPSAIKSGIIIGAGIAAINSVFSAGGRFDLFPFSISITLGLAFYLIYSKHFSEIKERYKLLSLVGNLGILPIILLAVCISPLLKEANWPVMEWGLSKPNFELMINEYTVFGVGFPPLNICLLYTSPSPRD